MHQYLINAALQLVPVVTVNHPYDWVDEVIEIIKHSGVKYEVGAFNTVVEGTYQEILNLVNDINQHLYQKECVEWILNIQIQIRAFGDMTATEKTEKFRTVEVH